MNIILKLLAVLNGAVKLLTGFRTLIISSGAVIAGVLVMFKIVPSPEIADLGLKAAVDFIAQLIGLLLSAVGLIGYFLRLAQKKLEITPVRTSLGWRHGADVMTLTKNVPPVAILLFACLVLPLGLSGCARHASYRPGETFDKNGVSCGYRKTVDGHVPWCLPPKDGDEFDSRGLW